MNRFEKTIIITFIIVAIIFLAAYAIIASVWVFDKINMIYGIN